MDELRPGTIQMGPARLDLSYSAIVPPAERDNLLEISNLLTESAHRGQNHASSLMQEVCDQADQAGKLLMVLPQAFGTGGMTTDQLCNWYTGKFGFVALQLEPAIILIRMPQRAAQLWAADNARRTEH